MHHFLFEDKNRLTKKLHRVYSFFEKLHRVCRKFGKEVME